MLGAKGMVEYTKYPTHCIIVLHELQLPPSTSFDAQFELQLPPSTSFDAQFELVSCKAILRKLQCVNAQSDSY